MVGPASTCTLSTSRKHTTGFLVKNFGECCGSMVLTAACYLPSSHCIPAQKFVSMLGKLTHNRSPLVLDSTSVCAVKAPFHSLHHINWIDSHSRVDEDVTIGSCRITRLLFTDNLVLLAFSQHICMISIHSIGFLLRATEPEWKSALNTPRQGRNQLFISGGKFSINFIRWRHHAFSTVVQLFRKRSQIKFC